MAFPFTINPAAPAGTDSPSLGDDEFRALKQAILDIFGIPGDPTQLTAAALAIAAGGGMTVQQSLNMNSKTLSGLATMSGAPTLGNNLAAGGNKITGLGAGTVNGDAVRFEQLYPTSSIASPDGYARLPGGLIIQWKLNATTDVNGDGTWTYPIAFPAGIIFMGGTDTTGDNVRLVTLGVLGLASTEYFTTAGGVAISSTICLLAVGF
jgi:hypothetical protein